METSLWRSACLVAVLLACASARAQGIDPNDLAGTATLTFAEEFNSLSLWNGTGGRWEPVYWWAAGQNGATVPTNAEKQWYIDPSYAPTSRVRPLSISNGVLRITADRAPPDIRPLINGFQYTSGMITTYRSFSQRYGFFEMRAKLPAGQGVWPAFWMLPADGSWPPELDGVEMLGGDPTTIFMTVHSTASGTHTQAQGSAKVPDTSAAFHTYGVHWEPAKITWYFDGQPVFAAPPPADLTQPLYILINLAIGGAWPGDPDDTTRFPAVLEVDYVRAYRAKQAQP